MIRINRVLVTASGEPHQLLSDNLLQSACAKPGNHWAYEGQSDPAVLGAALLFGIAKNHPFAQGNKRTAFAALVAFLELNGYAFKAPDVRDTSQKVVDLIEGTCGEAEFADWLRPFIGAGASA